MLKWAYEYFKEQKSFTLPLYFQHEGVFQMMQVGTKLDNFVKQVIVEL